MFHFCTHSTKVLGTSLLLFPCFISATIVLKSRAHKKSSLLLFPCFRMTSVRRSSDGAQSLWRVQVTKSHLSNEWCCLVTSVCNHKLIVVPAMHVCMHVLDSSNSCFILIRVVTPTPIFFKVIFYNIFLLLKDLSLYFLF